MSSSISFKRKFFILKKEYSNMRHVNPMGHGKLELRNNRLNISIKIENAESNQDYRAILLGPNGIYDLGKIHTENNYGGKEDFDLSYKDLEGGGFPLEKISGILILRDKNILLGGYLDKNDKTIEKYIEGLMVSDIKPQKEERLEKEEKIVEKVEEVIAVEEVIPVEEVTPVEEIIAEEEAITPQDNQLEEKYIENDLYIPLDDPAQPSFSPTAMTEEEYDRALKEMFKDSDYDDDYLDDEAEFIDVESQRKIEQRNQTTSYVLNILNFFPYIEPFKIDLLGYNWWKISIEDPKEDKGFLPYFSYIAGGNLNYPLVQNTVTATALMRKYGHYLFGLYNVNDEVKFYVYGVPGDFTKEDHPQRGSTGFNTWFEGEEGIGYWLLYIDPLTGRIIYPINPMIPKD